MPTSSPVLVDDRLLVDRLLAPRIPRWVPRGALFTTQYWYYRAARAAVAGGSGELSGPFAALPAEDQARAIEALLSLPGDIGVPDARSLVPEMVEISRRHGRLNLLNVEAVAGARVLGARVMLSPKAARGMLPHVLESEAIRWSEVSPAT